MWSPPLHAAASRSAHALHDGSMVCTRPLVTALLVLAGQPAASPAVDLIGVWTGSPRGSPTQLMLAQQSDGAGAGSGGFELLCRTTDYRNPSVTPQAPPHLCIMG